MAWRDQLRQASWRGVAFEVEGAESAFGRRTVVHEYPGRDKPYAEDLGRSMRQLRIVGFILGDEASYFTRRDALIDAAETAGAGTLVHPYYGTLEVALVAPLQVTESVDSGRVARLVFDFVEAGALTFPTASTSTSGAIESAADLVDTTAAADFVASWDLAAVPEWVTTAAETSVATQTAAIAAAVSEHAEDVVARSAELTAALGAIDASVTTLVDAPSTLIADFQAAMDLVQSLEAYKDLAAAAGFDGTSSASVPSQVTADDNDAAIRRWVVRSALAGVVRQVLELTLTSYDEAVELRDELADLLDDEAAATTDGDAYDALVDLRVAVVQHINAGAANLARLRDVEVGGMTSALELAQLFYGDAGRADEIAVRNDIAHPGFIAPGAYRVLAS